MPSVEVFLKNVPTAPRRLTPKPEVDVLKVLSTADRTWSMGPRETDLCLLWSRSRST